MQDSTRFLPKTGKTSSANATQAAEPFGLGLFFAMMIGFLAVVGSMCLISFL